MVNILSAILYRLGGMKGWDTKFRDFGIPLISFWAINADWYIHLIAGLLLFGALTTYWDSVFGYDNFYIHGLAIGLAYMPYIYAGISWQFLLIRAICLGIFMGGLNWVVHRYKVPYSDWIEELSRGAVIPIW